MDFQTMQALNLREVKNEISFSVEREDVFTEHDDRISKKAVTRFTPEGKKVLGLTSPKRQIIPYGDMMDWVVNEFDGLGIPFKLTESSLVKKSDDLFQNYVFGTPVDNPDGQNISPMLILRGSHVSTPLRIDMGTFRFVCSNGVMVGNTISSIVVKAKDLDGLLRFGLRDEIRHGMDAMTEVSKRYDELASEEMEGYLMSLLTEASVPVALKKGMVDHLSYKGTIEMQTTRNLKNNDFFSLRLHDDGAVVNKEGESIFQIQEKQSAWRLYNDATEISTHNARSESARSFFYKTISDVFVA